MKEKGVTTAVMAAVIVVVLVVAGIGVYFVFKGPGLKGEGEPGGISVPAGFSKTAEGPEDGYTVTTYTGSGTVEDAASSFKTALQDAGWTYTGVTENFPISQYIGGVGFEKGNEVAVVVAMEEAGQVTVHVVIGPKPGEGEEEGEIVESPEGMPLYEGAEYIETQNILGVQGSAYTISAHSADVYKCFIDQMPGLGWGEVSRGAGVIYFEKGDYGAAIKATEDVGPQTRLVIGYALKAEFEPIEEENVLPPTDYQTTFPAPTDVFIVFFTDYPPSAMFSQTHATIVGLSGKNFERSDQEGYYRSIITFYHNAGLKYTGSTLSTFDAYSDTHLHRPDLLEAACVDIDGEGIMFEWEGLPWQCTNNPIWREFLLEVAKRSIDCGVDGVHIDEWLGTYSAAQEAGGCFCEYCMQGFREYLREKYSTEELESFGIEDIDNFDYGDFIREQGTEALQPDFLDYQMASIREFWHESISEIRAYAREKGKDVFSVSANVPDLMANWMPIQDEINYLFSEYTYDYPPKGRSVPTFKLVRSLGKPLVVEPQTSNAALLQRSDLATLMKIYTAEAYSARGFLMVPYDIPAMTPEGWEWYNADIEELSPYYDFIHNNEPCYDNLFSTSKIAVLCSLSSARWSGTDDFYRISELILNSHFQYDVLFAGDNDWMEDNLSLSQLNEYEVVTLPNTRNLSDRQVSLLLSYAESGGNIVAFGEIGSHNEEGNEVERGLLESLLVEGSHDYGLGKFIYNGSLPTREEASGTLSGLIQPCIQTNANENVVMLEYWNNETHSIVIHLINYAYDIETEHLSPQENINLEVVLDPELLGKDLSISYMSPDWTGIEELSYTLSDGSVEFQVPNLEFYGVVSIGEASD